MYIPERLPAFQQVSLINRQQTQHTTFGQLHKQTLWSLSHSVIETLRCGVNHSILALLNLLGDITLLHA